MWNGNLKYSFKLIILDCTYGTNIRESLTKQSMEQLLIIYHLSLTLNLILPTASDQITNICFQIQTSGLSLLLVTEPL